jgi:phage gp16-like protein
MPPSKADLAKIHIAKKELGLTDEVYRDIMRARFGKSKDSAAKLTPGQAFSLLAYFRKIGWKPKGQEKLPGMDVPTDGQSKKIQALWITLHQAKVVRDGSDKALMAFVKRMTATKSHPGKDHLRFCDGSDKWKIIEALKDWAKREDVDVG